MDFFFKKRKKKRNNNRHTSKLNQYIKLIDFGMFVLSFFSFENYFKAPIYDRN